ncbi:MAG TPA: Plug domain-containing protein [Gemmatimonadaceae bacterium]
MRSLADAAMAIVGAALLVACSHPAANTGALSPDEPGVIKQGNALVITADLLHNEGRSLLDLLQRRLPNLRVDNTASCPEVYLRGRSSLVNSSDAAIYVDGQRAANTCILEALYPFNLDLVEIYPMGVSSRPGYLSDPNGLILIFLRRQN